MMTVHQKSIHHLFIYSNFRLIGEEVWGTKIFKIVMLRLDILSVLQRCGGVG